MEQKLLEWKAKEFENYDRSPGWYLTLSILAALLVIYELIQRDWFAAITLLIIAGIVYFFSKLVPREIDVVISDKAVEVDRARYTYPNIHTFWISEFQGLSSLHLETTAYLNRFITILIENQDPEEVRVILKKYIPETLEKDEGLARRISRHLKF